MAQPKKFFASLRLPLAMVVLLSAVPLTPRPAIAGPGDRIAYLNKKAMEDYDALEFESARKTLTDAIALLRKTGSDTTVQAARTYINLGMVYIALKDKSRGQQQFVKALTINPKAKLDPTLATPEMQLVWDSAVAQQTGAPPPVAPIETPQVPVQTPPVTMPPPGVPNQTPPPNQNPDLTDFPTTTPPVKNPGSPLEYNADELLDPILKVELRHVPPDEARAGQKLNLYITPVAVHQGGAVARATLYYRGAGQERFTEQAMQPSRKQQGDLIGQIPPEAVNGKSLQYYVQAFDAKGRLCGNQGTPESPLIVRIQANGPAVVQGTDVEDPILYVKRADEERRARESHDWVYVDIGVGSGGAIVTSGATAEVSWFYNRATSMYERSRASTGGFIWSGVGIRAEVGVFVWRGLSIGISGRFEGYLNHNADSQINALAGTTTTNCPDAAGRPSPCYATTSKGEFGYMALGKFRYMFRKLYGNYFRPYVHLDVGGGQWRGALNIDGSRPQLNGAVDNSSPFQPTDVCSATYNGNMNNKMPPGCNSVASTPGYNLQDHSTSVVPTNLNRVCPAGGACIDAVLLGKAMVGGGGGFYVGGRRAGISLDVSILAAVGDQFGLFIDAYVSPQINF